jgi:hypothetical protein
VADEIGNQERTEPMKMMMTIVGVIGLITPFAHAKIGETPEQCEKRYGVPLDVKGRGDFRRYQKGAVLISCDFFQGKCHAVGYEIANYTIVLHPSAQDKPRFTKDQAFQLLNFNRQASAWTQTSKEGFGKPYDGTYKTEDGKLNAIVNFVAVNIESVEFYQFKKAKIQQAGIEKAMADFGAGPSVLEPRPKTGTFPLSKDEQDLKDMDDSLKDFKKATEDIKNLSQPGSGSKP